jgi:hypothetical protein
MIQNSKFILGFKSKKTGEFLPLGETNGPHVPENDYIEHLDGSVSVRFEFPELEVDE